MNFYDFLLYLASTALLPRSDADPLALKRRARRVRSSIKKKSSAGVARFTLDSPDSGYL
jgi:hypothetical protein